MDTSLTKKERVMKINKTYVIDVDIEYDERSIIKEQAEAIVMALIGCSAEQNNYIKFKIIQISDHEKFN